MANRLQEAAENALPKLPYSLATMALPRIFMAPGGSDPKMRAGVEDGNALSPIYIGDEKDFSNPDYTPQLLGHEMYHEKVNNLPPKLRSLLPPGNPNDPYNYGGTAGLRKVGGDPLKLSNEQGAAAMQYLISQRQGGNKLDPIYNTFERRFGELPLSVMQPTDPKQKGINITPRPPGRPPESVWGAGNMLHADQKFKPGDPEPGQPEVDWSTAQPINGNAAAATPQPGTIGPAAPQPWLTQLGEDLRGGGNRTFVGRALGDLQGNGKQGYSGLESGVSPQTADFMGSVPLGAVKTAQGVSEFPQHPFRGIAKIGGGLLQMGTIPLSIAAPEAEDAAASGAGRVAGKLADMLPIPTRAKAGRLFEDVMSKAADQPVTLTRSGDQLLRVRELADNGTSMPQAAGKLLRRVTDPEAGQLTYRPARDFASNISRASANETMRLSPPMQRELGLLRPLLNADVGDAAVAAGKGSEYDRAMRMYARASRNAKIASNSGKLLLKYGVPGGAVYEGYKGLTKK